MPSERTITMPRILAFIFSSKPVLHGLKVTLLKTQSSDSLANRRFEALKMPKIARTTNATMQNILYSTFPIFFKLLVNKAASSRVL